MQAFLHVSSTAILVAMSIFYVMNYLDGTVKKKEIPFVVLTLAILIAISMATGGKEHMWDFVAGPFFIFFL